MQFSKRIKLPLIPSLLESNEMPASLALTLQHQCFLLHRDQRMKIGLCILVTLHLEVLELFKTCRSNKIIEFVNESSLTLNPIQNSTNYHVILTSDGKRFSVHDDLLVYVVSFSHEL